jgi:hypothetical protein
MALTAKQARFVEEYLCRPERYAGRDPGWVLLERGWRDRM